MMNFVLKMMNFVFKIMDFVKFNKGSKGDEDFIECAQVCGFCIKKDEFCITNGEFCIDKAIFQPFLCPFLFIFACNSPRFGAESFVDRAQEFEKQLQTQLNILQGVVISYPK